jgi:chromatin remodeling complex protein RSC6
MPGFEGGSLILDLQKTKKKKKKKKKRKERKKERNEKEKRKKKRKKKKEKKKKNITVGESGNSITEPFWKLSWSLGPSRGEGSLPII